MCNQPVNKIRHYVMDNSITELGVHLVLYQWLNNKLCVSSFTEIMFLPIDNSTMNKIKDFVLVTFIILLKGSFCNEMVNERRHIVLADSLTWLGVPFVLYQWFKQTLYVSYFTQMIPQSFSNWPVNKCRHYVVAILLVLLRNHSVTNQWIKSDTMC